MLKIRILLVEHQLLMRSALRALLEAQPDMEVVGEASHSRTALAKAHEATPDVILLVLSLPGASGLQAVEQLSQAYRHGQIVVLTRYQEAAYVRAVLTAGGAAYITTSAASDDLFSAIREVARGQTFVDPALAGPLLHEVFGKQAPRPTATPSPPRTLLSPREREVLIRLAQGYTNRQIAEQIYVSVKSVETYRARIVQKLELHSRVDLIRYAHVSGLLTPDMVLGRYNEATL
jgi:two-component system response regulator NreC